MKPVIRHVRDIKTGERRALEHVIGRQLKPNQQVIIQIVTFGRVPVQQAVTKQPVQLPEWCNVYAGLTSKQIADVEGVILQRADLSRPS